ncbi:MBOAT family O-acyltransferase [Niabella hirudinis]|uniref:MBOAT family O-acyltransferase n=1 Tax=Niabella hirudinis TaxID=1285929 RepID=UPI003EBE0CD6
MISLGTAVLSWLLPGRWGIRGISIITLLYLAWMAPVSLVLLIFTAVAGYFILHTGGRIPLNVRLICCLFLYTGILLHFKIQVAFASAGTGFLVPLGLSYYLFKQIHYAFEVYKKKLMRHSAEEYFIYLFFLPVLLVGPINRFPDFLKDLRRRRWNGPLASYGLQRCLFGYAKIVIVANYIFSYKIQQLTENKIIAADGWLANYLSVIRFPMNAYFQFAGYSDIAIGLSAIMGFRIMENFRNPFMATNLNEFWRRYHISLSSWCRDYVFTPVASYTRNVYMGVIVSMLVLSLWHEISLNYFIWGMVQAAGIMLSSRLMRFKSPFNPGRGFVIFEKGFKMFLVFHFFALSCILIKPQSWQSIMHQFRLLFNF